MEHRYQLVKVEAYTVCTAVCNIDLTPPSFKHGYIVKSPDCEMEPKTRRLEQDPYVFGLLILTHCYFKGASLIPGVTWDLYDTYIHGTSRSLKSVICVSYPTPEMDYSHLFGDSPLQKTTVGSGILASSKHVPDLLRSQVSMTSHTHTHPLATRPHIE